MMVCSQHAGTCRLSVNTMTLLFGMEEDDTRVSITLPFFHAIQQRENTCTMMKTLKH